jgi:hypothetical protein
VIDFFNLTVHRIHNKPPEWQWFYLNARDMPEDFIQVQGGVPTAFYKSGPRKGRPKWGPREDYEKLWIRRADVKETEHRWESETGKCHACEGSGERMRRVSAATKEFVTCSRCSGSGKAVVAGKGE